MNKADDETTRRLNDGLLLDDQKPNILQVGTGRSRR